MSWDINTCVYLVFVTEYRFPCHQVVEAKVDLVTRRIIMSRTDVPG